MFRMKSKEKSSKDSLGMTYLEILICLIIVAIIVAPLSASLISSTKIRVESESISESTLKAEALLGDVKLQISKDIAAKLRREGNRPFPTDPDLYIDDISTPLNPIKYLCTTGMDITVKLEKFINGIDVEKKYSTDKYAYEVAIWNAKSAPIIPGTEALALKMDGTTLNSAALKVCSSTEMGLNFDTYGPPYTSDVVIKYDMTSGAANILNHKLFLDDFIPDGNGYATGVPSYTLTDVATISFKKDSGTKEISSNPITYAKENLNFNINTKNIKDSQGKLVGHTYEIEDLTPPVTTTNQGTVILDLRQHLRDLPTTPTTPPTFKFINDTGYPIVIKVVRNHKENENLDIIDSNINIITIDKASGGTTVIERITDIDFQDSYIIAVIVRDKNPRLGQPGKIIKKMVDVYSYTPIK